MVKSKYFQIYYQDAPYLIRLTYHLTECKHKGNTLWIKNQMVQPEELRIHIELH